MSESVAYYMDLYTFHILALQPPYTRIPVAFCQHWQHWSNAMSILVNCIPFFYPVMNKTEVTMRIFLLIFGQSATKLKRKIKYKLIYVFFFYSHCCFYDNSVMLYHILQFTRFPYFVQLQLIQSFQLPDHIVSSKMLKNM